MKRTRHVGEELTYRLCPGCFRAVPASTGERYCANDGLPLLDACPVCGAAIRSPYARHCVTCGAALSGAVPGPAPPRPKGGLP